MSAAINQARLFRRLRWRQFVNSYREMMAQSLVRPVTILLSAGFVCGFVFVVSFLGLRFLVHEAKVPPDEGMVGLLISLLFFTLGVALTFSTGLILHGTLFAGPETAFLLARPVTADHVFAYKFQTAVAFSSWAFLLLGCPVLVAYGIVAAAPWWFYVLMPLYFLGFTLLPGSAGALLALLLVNFVPNRRRTLLVVLIIATVLAAGWWVWSSLAEGRRMAMSADPMSEAASAILNRVSFARSLWLPSAWVTAGLQAAGRGDLGAALFRLALVWSNGLFLYLLVTWLASVLYRRGYNRIATGGDLRRRHGGAWVDGLLSAALWWAHPGTRLLIVKDFRTFRRDPQQWGQVLLFSVLLIAYFGNIRRMFIRDIEWPYQNALSALNVCAVSLLLCTFTGRFVYPLLSLEGRKFWVLGLLPLSRDRILWGKFGFATVGGLLLAVPLVLLSDLMLEVPWPGVLIHVLAVGTLTTGLSGLSVGLGATMPNFRETDPSKIAVGFGGTVNLVLGLLFLLVILATMVGPYHAFMATVALDASPSPLMWPVVVFGLGCGLAVGALAVLVPLRMGVQTLRAMEF